MKKIIFAAALLFGLCGAAFASYEDAIKLYEAGQYRESLKAVADILDISRDLEEGAPNYKLRFLAAHNHWKLGNEESAYTHFTRCMDMKNKSVDPYIDLSLMYLDLRKVADADRWARRGLQREKHGMLYFVLGEVSLRQGNGWRAKEMFETANSMMPDNFASYNGLGMALMRLGKFGEANTAFSVALALSPKSSQVLNNLGFSLEKLGKVSEAVEYYKQAQTLDGENKVIAANLERAQALIK